MSIEVNIYQLIYNVIMFTSYTIGIHMVLLPKYGKKSCYIYNICNMVVVCLCLFLPENTFPIRNLCFISVQLICCFFLYEDASAWKLFAMSLMLIAIFVPESLAILIFFMLDLDIRAVVDEMPYVSLVLYSGILFVYGSVRLLTLIKQRMHIPPLLMISVAIFLFTNFVLTTQCMLFEQSGIMIPIFFLFNMANIVLMFLMLYRSYKKQMQIEYARITHDNNQALLRAYRKLDHQKDGEINKILHDLHNDLQTILILKETQKEQER